MQLNAQAGDLRRLQNAEEERDSMSEALHRSEILIEEQQPRLDRAEGKVAILQAEVEQVHNALRETEDQRREIRLTRTSEGFRIIDALLRLSLRQRLFEGFFFYRACVLDRAAWRLGMARRASQVGKEVPLRYATARKPPSSKEEVDVPSGSVETRGTQTNAGYIDRSLNAQYNLLMQEAKEKSNRSPFPPHPPKGTSPNIENGPSSMAYRMSLLPNAKDAKEVKMVKEKEKEVLTPSKRGRRVVKTATEVAFSRDIHSIQEAVKGVLSERQKRPSGIKITAGHNITDHSKEGIRRMMKDSPVQR